MTIKEFQDLYNLICTNDWDDALDAWFEAVGQMCTRGLDIPKEWEYKAGIGDVLNEDNPFHKDFNETTDAEIILIAEYLFNYLKRLKAEGKDQ